VSASPSRRRASRPRSSSAHSAGDPASYTPGFSWRGGLEPGQADLCCEDVRLEEIADREGTPAYVYSAAAITGAYRKLDQALGRQPHTLCYAVKANSNLSILRLLARLGSGFDIVSAGELFRLQRAGVESECIVFSGVGKSRDEIREALRARIGLFNIESAAELDILASEASRSGSRAPAAIRVNPDVAAGGHPHISTGHHSHKFGIDWEDARRLYLQHRDSRWIEWRGISAHIGSQILSLAPFRQALTRLARYYRELRDAGIKLHYLDFGGGLGVRYSDEKPFSPADYAQAITTILRPLGCHLLLEPGRSLVASAGVVLMRVLYPKENRRKKFVVVDAAMNDFIRPALYDAVHPISSAKRAEGPAGKAVLDKTRADIVGPVCESGDCFAQDWPMAPVSAGDLLVLWGAGAYGFVESSNYNSRPRPAEILVEGNRFRVIRRRESFTDLVRGE
jgi:diaminopimelate decarboxylase